jgi:alkanesulfonate monooxygenase SsuD/methylene tetrahydromethanopterin reductase-like flavin-dependent oxidoreductase (luciferase family)
MTSSQLADRLQIGMCFDRTFPPSFVLELARRLDNGGADQLWVIEDCFYTTGVSLAAAALSVTERLTVGIGILPAVARTAAITAMEIATLTGLGTGRLLPGLGHGVQSWMGQMGVRPASPVTVLEEVLVAVRRLLAGERVTMHGTYVHLDEVQLDQPPADPPPLLTGVRGPRSLAMAGQSAQGVILAEPAGPSYVRWALKQANRRPSDTFHVAAYGMLCVTADRKDAYRAMAPWLGSKLEKPTTALRALPFYDDLMARYRAEGVAGLATMPREWWTELGPVGTIDDVATHLQALQDAGAHSVGLFLTPDVQAARSQLADVLTLVSR